MWCESRLPGHKVLEQADGPLPRPLPPLPVPGGLLPPVVLPTPWRGMLPPVPPIIPQLSSPVTSRADPPDMMHKGILCFLNIILSYSCHIRVA